MLKRAVHLRLICGFLFGSASAIRAVAGNRAALWTGIVLVLLTGIARNYDQTYFLETPMWLIGPLAFSLFSGSFLYGILIRGFARRHFPEEQRNAKQWATFMGLFWMTAPIAWLYAIPVERFLNSYQAAQANIALLATVSIWRVMLMSRVIAVLYQLHFLRALVWVLVAASLEVIVVMFFGAPLSNSILAGMAGMRNAPEQSLLNNVLGGTWAWSWGGLLVCVIVLASRRFQGVIRPMPEAFPGKVPWSLLLSLVIMWTLIAVQPQREQYRFVTHAALVTKGDYTEALTYLARHKQSDFPASRRLEPNPYTYRVWKDLPPTISRLTVETTPWIRQVYLNHLTTTLEHYHSHYDLTNVTPMLLAMEALPEGRDWVLTNQVAFARRILGRYIPKESKEEWIERTNILQVLSRMGMSETNLSVLTN